MPRVRLPDGTILSFPEGMSEADMAAAIDTLAPAPASPAPPTAPASSSPKSPAVMAPLGNTMDAEMEALVPPPPVDTRPLLERPPAAGVVPDSKDLSTAERIQLSKSPDTLAREAADARYVASQPSLKASPRGGMIQSALDTTLRKPLDGSLGGLAVEALGDVGRGAARASAGIAGSLYSAGQVAGETLGAPEGLTDFAAAAGAAARQGRELLGNRQDRESLTQQIFESVFTNVPVLVTLGTGNAALAAMGAQAAAADYGASRDRGLSHGDAVQRAGYMGIAEMLGERLSLPVLGRLFSDAVSKAGNAQLGKTLAELLVKEQVGEQATTALQAVYEKAGIGGSRPDMTLEDYLDDVANTAKVTLGQSLVMGGAARVVRDLSVPPVREPGLPDYQALMRDKGFGSDLLPAGDTPDTTNFTPPDSPTARAGLVPIVVPAAAPLPAEVEVKPLSEPDAYRGALAALAPLSPAGAPVQAPDLPATIEQAHSQIREGTAAAVAAMTAGDTAGADAANARVKTALAALRAATAAQNERAKADEKAAAAAPVAAKTWTGRSGNGYATEADANMALPGLATRNAENKALDWKVEPREDGRFELRGYPRAEGAAPAPLPSEWQAFPPESGTKGIPRADMPQVAQENRGALVNFLAARGIASEQVEVPADSLKPTQAEFSPKKVAAAKASSGRAVLISSDGHVVDGHHEWLARQAAGEPVKALRLDAPIDQLVPAIREFPSSFTRAGAKPGTMPATGETNDRPADASAGLAGTPQPGAGRDGAAAAGAARDAGPGAAAAVDAGARAGSGDLPAAARPAVDPAQVATDLVAIQDSQFKRHKVVAKLEAVQPSGDNAALFELASGLSTPVTFFRDTNGKMTSQGIAVGRGRVYINVEAKQAPLVILMHEGVHTMPEAIRRELERRVLATVTPEKRAVFEKMFPSYAKQGKTDEEMVAMLAQDEAKKPQFWLELADKLGESSFAKVARHILKTINSLMASAKGKARGPQFTGLSDDIEAVRDALTTAYSLVLKGETTWKDSVPAGEATEVSESRMPADFTDPEARVEVSTTSPRAKKSADSGYTQKWVISGDDVKSSETHVKAVVQALRTYNTLSGKGDARTVMQELHDVVVENLLWLHDLVPAGVRARAKLWYDGANAIATDWTQKYGITERQAAGVLAVLSPQMDWFKNVSLAERVITTWKSRQGEAWSPAMTAWVESWVGASKTVDEKAARQRTLDDARRLQGTRLGDMDDRDAARFVRVFDETYNERSYRLVTPEGGFGDYVTTNDDGDASVTWGGFATIEKAISILNDGSFRNVDAQLGDEHKVRNFNNNIIRPNSADGHVTIDTHAVAAALVKALSGSKPEVADNFGGAGSNAATGASGTYALLADAYRDAAAQRGVLAREMQSITWEAVRALFPASIKDQLAPQIDAVWDRFKTGEITRDQARKEVFKLSGGIRDMAWEGSDAGQRAAEGGTSYRTELDADPEKRAARRLDPVATKDRVSVTLSAATGKIPGLARLYELAGKGDAYAHQLLQDIGLDALHHLLGGTSAKIKAERATGLYAGSVEPSLGLAVTFADSDRAQVLAALAKFGENFAQEQIHVRGGTKAKAGTQFDDGSYATPVYRWALKKSLDRKQIQKIIDKSGLYGLTFGDDFVEAYYVGDPANEEARAEFDLAIGRADSLLGKAADGVGRSVARLWPYGEGDGTIGYDRIRGDVAAGPASESDTARRVAEYLNRVGDKPGRVRAFGQAAEVTPEQRALQEQVAAAYEARPDNDLSNPRVRKAYAELAKEVLRQFDALPVRVEVLSGQGEPYANSAEMRRDVLDNNHLFIFGTTPETFGPEGVDFTGHPLLEPANRSDSRGTPLLLNDLLRAVHDYFAHTLAPTQFGPRGEEAAWRNHMSMTANPWARWALTSETRGQNSWVNFNAGLDQATPIKDRPFARQKAMLLPVEYTLTGDRQVDAGMKEFIAALPVKQRQGSAPEVMESQAVQGDLFPGEFASKRTTVKTGRLISSKGDTAKGVNVNSAGQKVSATKAGLANFWSWFGNSEAVDADGRPLVLYHSTNADVAALRPGQKTTNNYGLLGDVEVSRAGIFTTPDRDFSQEYLREGAGRNVVQLYAKIENALDLRRGLSERDEAALEAAGVNIRYVTNIQNYWELFDNEDDGTNSFVDGMRAAGYDGAIFREDSPSGDTAGGTTYMVLDPSQLKSVFNRGTYSSVEDGILESQDTPEFAAWFGASKAVDAAGKPLTLYTGTSKDVDFKKFKAPANGIWFTGDPKSASEYARENDSKSMKYDAETRRYADINTADRVMPVNVRIENPKVYEQWPDKIRLASNYKKAQGQVFAELRAQGYDGVRLGDVWVAFEANQVKGLFNRGTYSRTNDDILASEDVPDASRLIEQVAYTGWPPPIQQPVNPIPAGRNLATLLSRLDAGKITAGDFELQVRLLASRLASNTAQKAENAMAGERARGADFIREKLLAARRRGDLDPDAVEFALWAIDQNPTMVETLGISVRTAGDRGVSGDYNPAAEIMRVFKGGTNTGTAVHEILHHTERMMPDQVQAGLRGEWSRAYARELGAATGDVRVALEQIPDAIRGNRAAQYILQRAFGDGTLDYDRHYQLVNPSEYWAVNATRIMGARFEASDSWVRRAGQWLGEMLQKVKGLLRLRSDAPVLRGLEAVLSGDGSRRTPAMLSEGVTTRDMAASPAIDEAIEIPYVFEADELDRTRLVAGQRVFAAVGAVANKVLLKVAMKPMGPELRRAVRQMKVEVAKAQDTAAGVAEQLQKLAPSEREMISDVIERELKRGVTPPAEVLQLARSMSAAMSTQADELVRLGMLSQETADAWRDQYLPRFYETKIGSLATNAWKRAVGQLMGRPRAMAGIGGKSLKRRGITKAIDVVDLPAYLASGWTQSDPKFDPAVDTRTVIHRDFTKAERVDMGEIRDSMFRFVMGYMRSQKDIALGRLYERLAQDIASRVEMPGYVLVPSSMIEDTHVRTYGKLAGKWVPAEVMHHLSAYSKGEYDGLLQLYRKGLAMWKEGKTVLNPVAHANNVLSNLTSAHFAGVSYWDSHKYIGAVKDLVKGSPMVTEARDAGLFLGTFSQEDLLQAMPEPLRMLAQVAESKGEKAVNMVWNALSFWLRKPMGVAYEAEDQFFRYLLYRDGRKNGLDPQAAIDHAQTYIFAYDDLPSGAKLVRDTALPFFGYTYKVVPMIAHTATAYPWRFAAPATLVYLANTMMYAIAQGADEDDDWRESIKRYIDDPAFRAEARKKEEGERANLPPWMKGGSFVLGTSKTIRLGTDDLTNLPVFLDISRMFPGGDLLDANNNAGGMPLLAPITPSNPLLSTFSAMVANRDLYFGKDIVDGNDTSAEAAEKRGQWLWQQFTPAIAVNNYHWNRGMNALSNITGDVIPWWPADATGFGRDGLPVQAGYSALQTFGIKARPIDLDMSERIQASQKQKIIKDLQSEIIRLRELDKKGAVSPDQAETMIERNRLKIERIREGLTVDGEVAD